MKRDRLSSFTRQSRQPSSTGLRSHDHSLGPRPPPRGFRPSPWPSFSPRPRPPPSRSTTTGRSSCSAGTRPPLVAGGPVAPNWIHDTDRFWYRNNTGAGYEFTFVDPASNVKRPLFDHYRLAAALSLAADTSYVPEKLPFDDFDFVDGDESRIEFASGAKRFECDIGAYMCQAGDTLPDDTPFAESPDERWEAFVTDHNLFVRPVAGGDTIQLTTDGEEFNGYGLAYPRPNDVRNKVVRRPDVYWSPDSRKLLVQRE